MRLSRTDNGDREDARTIRMDDIPLTALDAHTRNSGALQAIIDGFAQPFVRDGHHGDCGRGLGVEVAKVAEKIRRSLHEIAGFGQIHDDRPLGAGDSVWPEGKQSFAGLQLVRIQPDTGSRCIVRGQHARRQRLGIRRAGVFSVYREGLDRDIQIMRSGFTIEGAEPDVDLPPPWLGEHTDSILAELGYDAAEIAALHERGDV